MSLLTKGGGWTAAFQLSMLSISAVHGGLTPLTLRVLPVNNAADAASHGLGAAQQALRESLLQTPDRDIVVMLEAGRHRVPAGGLLLTTADSSSGTARAPAR